jgi:hypothetical protein
VALPKDFTCDSGTDNDTLFVDHDRRGEAKRLDARRNLSTASSLIFPVFFPYGTGVSTGHTSIFICFEVTFRPYLNGFSHKRTKTQVSPCDYKCGANPNELRPRET